MSIPIRYTAINIWNTQNSHVQPDALSNASAKTEREIGTGMQRMN